MSAPATAIVRRHPELSLNDPIMRAAMHEAEAREWGDLAAWYERHGESYDAPAATCRRVEAELRAKARGLLREVAE